MTVRHLDTDIACIRCGYNLRTLAINARCPECGEWVATSGHEFETRSAERRWLMDVARGSLSLALTAPIVLSYIHGLWGFAGRNSIDKPLLVGVTAIGALAILGTFLITGRAPRVSKAYVGPLLRLSLRLCVVLFSISLLVMFVCFETSLFDDVVLLRRQIDGLILLVVYTFSFWMIATPILVMRLTRLDGLRFIRFPLALWVVSAIPIVGIALLGEAADTIVTGLIMFVSGVDDYVAWLVLEASLYWVFPICTGTFFLALMVAALIARRRRPRLTT